MTVSLEAVHTIRTQYNPPQSTPLPLEMPINLLLSSISKLMASGHPRPFFSNTKPSHTPFNDCVTSSPGMAAPSVLLSSSYKQSDQSPSTYYPWLPVNRATLWEESLDIPGTVVFVLNGYLHWTLRHKTHQLLCLPKALRLSSMCIPALLRGKLPTAHSCKLEPLLHRIRGSKMLDACFWSISDQQEKIMPQNRWIIS